MDETMVSDLARYARKSGWLGRSPAYYATVDSTNDVALAAAAEGRAEGMVVIADVQRAGRGRLHRRWVAPPGSSLLMSLLLRPPAPFSTYASRTMMVCGLALQQAVRDVCNLATKLKWPNDLIYEPEDHPARWLKLAGMLSEVHLSESGQPTALVVGLGINVAIEADQLPAIAPNAGSLSVLVGAPVSRVALLDTLLDGIEARYDRLRAGHDPIREWRNALAWLGKPVEVASSTGHTSGIAEDVDGDGNLVVRIDGGDPISFSAGDISLRPA